MIALFSSLLFLSMLRPYGTSFFFPDSFIYRRNIPYGICCAGCFYMIILSQFAFRTVGTKGR